MTQHKRVLGILAYTSGSAPSMAEFQAVVTGGRNTLASYWADNAAGVIQLDTIDFAGPVSIVAPVCQTDASGLPVHDTNGNPIRTSRKDTIATAKAAPLGVNPGDYDIVLVMLHPGFVTFANGEVVDYDVGAYGSDCLVPATQDLTYLCHEIGHTLGFIHSNGMPNTGSDWDGAANGRSYDFPYGDPYDLMSSATFGGDAAIPSADSPTFAIPAPAGYASMLGAGPMPARAQLYYSNRAELEQTGVTLHRPENGNTSVVIGAAGAGGPDPELLVYDAVGGTLLVEFRTRGALAARNYWDSGLDAVGRAMPGVVVHYIASGTPFPGVWYAGRIVFPSPDLDATVETPFGEFTVSVADSQRALPSSVAVTVRRGRPNQFVNVYENEDRQVQVVASEKRTNPRYPGHQFTWQSIRTTLTTTYTPRVHGVGSGFPDHELLSNDGLTWSVDGATVPTAPSGTIGTLLYTLSDSGVLTLHNDPSAGHIVANVHLDVRDTSPGAGAPIRATADTTYEVYGTSDGWGADFILFLGGLLKEKIHVSVPEPVGPPSPEPYWKELVSLREVYGDLLTASPEAAAEVKSQFGARESALAAAGRRLSVVRTPVRLVQRVVNPA
jgi:hypothetical protein